MLDWFYELLKHKISLETLEERLSHSEVLFDQVYTFIVDGSEQPINNSSKDTRLNAEFYSAKKKKATINILVVISTKDFKVLYISPSYPGSINDEEIVRLTRRDWLDKLNPNERGMGDHGFNGMNRNGGCIETPPKEQNLLYKVFSHFRIRVEQIFEKIHDFRATKDQIRSPLKGNRDDVLLCHQKKWVVAAVFVTCYR